MAWEVLITDKGTVNDTINLIVETILRYKDSPAVINLVKKLPDPNNRIKFLRKLFEWVCSNVKYTMDPDGHEKVNTPERTMRDGFGDCKKMTTLIAAVLARVGIPCYLKVISYNGITYEHIYVVVPYPADNSKTYIVVDPVAHCKFNYELPHKLEWIWDLKRNTWKMKLSLLGKLGNEVNMKDFTVSGINNLSNDLGALSRTGKPSENEIIDALVEAQENEDTRLAGLGRKKLKDLFKKKTPEQKKAKKEKRKAKLKKFGLGTMRGAFLVLVKTNFLKIATKLSKAWAMKPSEVRSWWEKLGGDINILKNAISQGSGAKISGMGCMCNIGGVGVALATIVATAGTILGAAWKMIKNMGINKDGDAEDVAMNGALDEGDEALDNVEEKDLPRDTGRNTTNTSSSSSPRVNEPKPGGDYSSQQQQQNNSSDDSGGGGGSTQGSMLDGNSFFGSWIKMSLICGFSIHKFPQYEILINLVFSSILLYIFYKKYLEKHFPMPALSGTQRAKAVAGSIIQFISLTKKRTAHAKV